MSLLYTNKIPHPANFAFAPKPELKVTEIGGDVHRICLARSRGWKNPSQAQLAETIPGSTTHRIKFSADGTLQLVAEDGKARLRGIPGATFGRSGGAWMLQFRHERSMQFFGLGEHSGALEKTGQRVKFWNTDLISDYYFGEVCHGNPNPMYISVPWLVVKQGNYYVGLLIHHPGAVFMDLASNFIWASGNNEDVDRRSFYVGAPDGEPDIYLLVGPSLPELTRKLQGLVGLSPLPPLWALGYHQSRWGYAGPRDLNRLDRELKNRAIPCSGLWLDIDYMERYRVFTFARSEWGGRAQIRRSLAALRQRGRRVLAILDPGVKIEAGDEVCSDGLKKKIFCLNRAGRAFVGFVWPGHSHFPDFSREDGRNWWAERVADFATTGMAGAWLDMNDPSVGPTDQDDMLFDRGRQPHASFHNQYGLGMARASYEGWLASDPNVRPFLLSRSAYISSSRYTAVWTGDNMSNWHHLRGAIPMVLGLGLSGLPFNGADVCGFAIDATRELAIAWYKAAFLFPLFRNHNSAFVREQEPWTFGKSAERIIAHYVRLRYRFLPYLYQLFVSQAEAGEAILRPLFYDFNDRPSLPLGKISDQFMIGPALMQAPVVEPDVQTRSVLLPAGQVWLSLADGQWHRGGKRLKITASEAVTPLFVREGYIVPMRAGGPAASATDLREIELHLFLRKHSPQIATMDYTADDGETFDYQTGRRTRIRFTARCRKTGSIELRVESLLTGFGKLKIRVVVYDHFKAITLRTAQGDRELGLVRHVWRATGRPLAVRISPLFEL